MANEWAIKDGKTRLYLSLTNGYLSPSFAFYLDGTATINWGDGSDPVVIESDDINKLITAQYDYDDPGNYTVAITCTDTIMIGGVPIYGGDNDSHYACSIKRAEIGTGITTIGEYAFSGCLALTDIYIPSGVTGIAEYAFQNCYSLAYVDLPNTITGIGQYAFQNCFAMTEIEIDLSSALAGIGQYAFQNCHSLAVADVPTLASVGQYAFYGCYSLGY